MTQPLILASSSPRRRELLARVGIPYEIIIPSVDESCSLPADQAVLELSRRKALAVSVTHPSSFVLAADTLVCVDGEILGKPADKNDARRMLHLLSGRTHDVYTGVTLIAPSGEIFSGLDSSRVTFSALTDADIDAYIASGEPMDKAGAYAIQGVASFWIQHMEGSPSGVIGLPLDLVRRLLVKSSYLK